MVYSVANSFSKWIHKSRLCNFFCLAIWNSYKYIISEQKYLLIIQFHVLKNSTSQVLIFFILPSLKMVFRFCKELDTFKLIRDGLININLPIQNRQNPGACKKLSDFQYKINWLNVWWGRQSISYWYHTISSVYYGISLWWEDYWPLRCVPYATSNRTHQLIFEREAEANHS